MKKTVSITAFVLLISLGLLYLNQGSLIADDWNKNKDCSSQCKHSKDVKTTSGDYSSYEFITDKACCNEMKTELETSLMGVAGVKGIKFSSSCSVSHMTQVTVLYSAGETSESSIASFIKDKKYECEGHNGCNKDGKSSGSDNDCSKQCPQHKEKSKDTKQL
jgi:hypothetical protein